MTHGKRVGPCSPMRGLRRREMLRCLSGGIGSVALAGIFDALAIREARAEAGHYQGATLPRKAKHVICLFMAGGPSQLDLFDPKPKLARYAGQRPRADDVRTERSTGGLLPSPFRFAKHGHSGIELSELLPQLASVIDQVCLIRSMYSFNPTHLPARNLFHSGSVLSTRPSIGSWISYGLGSDNDNLPSFIALTPMGNSERTATRPGFLPPEHQGVTFNNAADEPARMIPDLRNPSLEQDEQRLDLDLLQRNNRRFGAAFPDDAFLEGRIKSLETAFRMQSEATDLFDLRKEPPAIREEYGTTPFGNGCLLARRLIESGVRYVHVNYDRDQPWDDHNDVAGKLKGRVPDMDRASAALIRDLQRRGLLDETLVVWGGEFGRTPVSESGTGRDHNPYGYSMFVAGGGFKPGLAYGATDEFGFKAVDRRVSIHDLHATLLHQLGIDHTQLTYRYAGRDFRLTDVFGNVVDDLLL